MYCTYTWVGSAFPGMHIYGMGTGHQCTSPTLIVGWQTSYDIGSQDNLELRT